MTAVAVAPASLETAVAAAVLLLARVGPLVVWTPLFGGPQAPRRLRFAVALLLVVALVPLVDPAALHAATGGWAAALGGEALFGLCLAVLVKAVFDGLAAAGAMIDGARGTTFANVLDPANQQQTSQTTAFLGVVHVAAFLSAGGHAVVFAGLARGVRRYPPGSLAAAPPIAPGELLDVVAELLALAAALALPVLAVVLLVDLALAWMNRAAGAIQVYFLGFPIKALLGLGVLVVVLRGIVAVVLEQAAALPAWLGGAG